MCCSEIIGRQYDVAEGEFVLCYMARCVSDTFYSHVFEIAKVESEPCMIQKVVEFKTVDEFDEFAHNMGNSPWMEGLGGFHSLRCADKEFENFTEDELTEFWENSYRYVVAVECQGRETLFIDPQGFDHPAFVGTISIE